MAENPAREPRRYNNDLPPAPPWISQDAVTDLGLAVGAVMRKYAAIGRVRDLVLRWHKEWSERRSRELDFESRRETHAKCVMDTDRLRDLKAGRPKPGWEAETIRLPRPDDPADPPIPLAVAGWVPPELQRVNAPPETGFPLPVPECEITLAEKFAALAAIHDGTTKATEKINPFQLGKSGWATYNALMGAIWQLPESDEKHLRVWLAEIEEHIGHDPQDIGAMLKADRTRRKTWEVPAGYMRASAVAHTDGKPVPRTTISRWQTRDKPKTERDPLTNEVCLPVEWVNNCLKTYNPRRASGSR